MQQAKALFKKENCKCFSAVAVERNQAKGIAKRLRKQASKGKLPLAMKDSLWI